jgi:hypothetical protein
MKTSKQLFEMYRDLKGRKCIDVAHEDVQQFVDYCYDVHDLVVNGGAFSKDGKRQFLYID